MTTTSTAASSRTSALGRSALLRTALKLDATVSALNGVAYLAGAAFLQELLGLPAGPVRLVGVFLLGYAAVVWYVGTRPRISRPAAWGVVAVNAIWVIGSVVVDVAGWGSPTGAGTTWIALQTLVVAGIGVLQWVGLKRSATT